MMTHVRLVDGSVLQFMLSQARLISSVLIYVVSGVGGDPDRVRLVLGADRDSVEGFQDRLVERIRSAHVAYEARTSPDASRVRIPVDEGHLIYTALIVSTHMTRSEEEYNIRVGDFKENALALAAGVLAAFHDH